MCYDGLQLLLSYPDAGVLFLEETRDHHVRELEQPPSEFPPQLRPSVTRTASYQKRMSAPPTTTTATSEEHAAKQRTHHEYSVRGGRRTYACCSLLVPPHCPDAPRSSCRSRTQFLTAETAKAHTMKEVRS